MILSIGAQELYLLYTSVRVALTGSCLVLYVCGLYDNWWERALNFICHYCQCSEGFSADATAQSDEKTSAEVIADAGAHRNRHSTQVVYESQTLSAKHNTRQSATTWRITRNRWKTELSIDCLEICRNRSD